MSTKLQWYNLLCKYRATTRFVADCDHEMQGYVDQVHSELESFTETNPEFADELPEKHQIANSCRHLMMFSIATKRWY